MQSNNKLSVYNPSNLQLIDNIEFNTATEVENALSTANDLYLDRTKWLPVHERIKILKNIGNLLVKRNEEFAQRIALEGGKPLKDARIEAKRAAEGIDIAIEALTHVQAGYEVPLDRSPMTAGRVAFTRRYPIGIVVAVSAFNHPLNLIVHQVIPAIAMGCPVIIKPASTTPLSCLEFCNLIRAAGLPDGWCQPLILQQDLATKLVCDKRVSFFNFIGSGKVGWGLRSKLAPGVRCALEHGGVAPVILDSDIDLNKVVPGLVKGGYYHAGQVCVSVQRVYAPKKIINDLAQQMRASCEKLVTGDASNDDTDVGPLILPTEVDRIHNWVLEAKQAGAKILLGGEKIEKK